MILLLTEVSSAVLALYYVLPLSSTSYDYLKSESIKNSINLL